MNKNITKIATKINGILESVRKRISEVELEIKNTENQILELEKKIEISKDNFDLEEYKKLVKEKEDLELSIQFSNAKIKKIKSEPLINESEHQKYSAEIKKELRKQEEDVIKILKELTIAYDQFNLSVELANPLLFKLQRQLAKEPEQVKVNDGFMTNHTDKYNTDYVIYSTRDLVKSTVCQKAINSL